MKALNSASRFKRISPTTVVSFSHPTRSLVGGAWNMDQATFLIAVVNDRFSAFCYLADLPAYLD
jgi:hypothetical protein